MLLQSRDTLYQISKEVYTKDDIVFFIVLVLIAAFLLVFVVKYILMSRDLKKYSDENHRLSGRSEEQYRQLLTETIEELRKLIKKGDPPL